MPSSANNPNDREDPRDCNPMFKRLPAEVVARRTDRGGKKAAAQEKAPATTVELEQVLQKRPDGRAKWLAKALVQASDGRLEPQSLYSVVAHNRFIEELNDKVGKKMYRALHANLHVFSSRQKKFLEKECALARKYAKTAFEGVAKEADGEDERQEQQASAVEDMMARCRAFVRERQSERGERAENGGDGEEPEPPQVSMEEASPAKPESPAALATAGRASRSRTADAPKEEVGGVQVKEAKASKSAKVSKKRAKSSRSSDSSRSRRRRSKRSSSSSGKEKRKRKERDSDESSDRKKKQKKKSRH
ncbi:unnamed protein product [Effrenium voratum]|uniref:Uncharacterized protein n=1 Tax=Effrenium voratum TaxID=2562239 RepID=A0AA36JGB9_9DINO|nr:unnamed protein product [Effrenium voratum]CAJ1405164.1 unnamed protein product [Effrenium voratum]CAJ1423810.1 unnamed protein product [Effrenium voratum]|mmetsp:Transcript_131204/g.311175  ORF Transcript_131204/g.311175 Transcript_131204/m.311175 type:complete len:305 (+) Transcript_131204:50-964(+)